MTDFDNDPKNARFQRVLDEMARGEHSGHRSEPRGPRLGKLKPLEPPSPEFVAITEQDILDLLADGPAERMQLYVWLFGNLRRPYWLYGRGYIDSVLGGLVAAGRITPEFSISNPPPQTEPEP